jgi:drug/metabolite transporter (DMT)-like permease
MMIGSVARLGRHRLALLPLVLGIIGISFSPIFVRLSALEPTATAVHRVGLALPVLALWFILEKPGPRIAPRRTTRRYDLAILLLSGLFWAGDLICWHWSIRMTSIANATFFALCAPIWVTAGAWLFLRERITKGFLAGLGLALAGGGFLAGSSLFDGTGRLTGDAVGLATAFFFGGYILTIKQLRGGLPTGMVMFLSGLFSLPWLVAVSLLSGESLVPLTLETWLVLIGLALISQAGGQGLIALAMASLPASFTAVALLLEPVLAAALGWAILGEALGPLQGIGCAVILAGVLICRRYGER